MSAHRSQVLSLGKCHAILLWLMCLAAASLSIAATPASESGNWPCWRGSNYGISLEKAPLPTYWDGKTNVKWKTAVPGDGNSSPIIYGHKLFLTSSSEKGKSRSVICLNADTGKMEWETKFAAEKVPVTSPKNGYASSTPACDGQRVYVFFDSPGLVALDLKGNKLWTRNLGDFKNPYNMASSPIVCGDKVIVVCDHDGPSFITAVDKSTGEIKWKITRKSGLGFATPTVINFRNKKQIVQNASKIISYDPADGKEIWSYTGMSACTIPTAVFANGLVYATSGRNGPSVSIDPSGKGDVTETHLKMHVQSGGPYVPSPLVYPCLFVPGDNGRMQFVGPGGKILIDQKLKGVFTASPVGAKNKIYWTNEAGDTYVVDVSNVTAAKPEIKVLGVNKLNEKTLASPAISKGRMYLRTVKNIYCLAGSAKPTQAQLVSAEKSGALGFDELKKIFDDNPSVEDNRPDVHRRVDVCERMATLKDPRVIPFLLKATKATNVPHYDINEAACKALGQQGEPATDALIELLNDERDWVKIIAADNLARIKPPKATAALLVQSKIADTKTEPREQVRVGCLHALGQIAAAGADATIADQIVLRMIDALNDPKGIVRGEAIDSLALCAEKTGKNREAAIGGLKKCLTDKNPAVSQKAKEALSKFTANSKGI